MIARMRSLLRSVLPLLALTALTACDYGDDDEGDYYSASCGGDPSASTIDPDATLQFEAGDGAGLFVEYAADGQYFFTTTCAPRDAGDGCDWDVIVTTFGEEDTDAEFARVDSISPVSFEEGDYLAVEAPDEVRYVAWTDSDFDGFVLATTPGASVRIDVLLDGGCGNGYVYWLGDGAVHEGAPSNPLDLTPSE